MEDVRLRGLEFEKFLNRLFDLFDLLIHKRREVLHQVIVLLCIRRVCNLLWPQDKASFTDQDIVAMCPFRGGLMVMSMW